MPAQIHSMPTQRIGILGCGSRGSAFAAAVASLEAADLVLCVGRRPGSGRILRRCPWRGGGGRLDGPGARRPHYHAAAVGLRSLVGRRAGGHPGAGGAAVGSGRCQCSALGPRGLRGAGSNRHGLCVAFRAAGAIAARSRAAAAVRSHRRVRRSRPAAGSGVRS